MDDDQSQVHLLTEEEKHPYLQHATRTKSRPWAQIQLAILVAQAALLTINLALFARFINFSATSQCSVTQRHRYEFPDIPLEMEDVTWDLTLGRLTEYTSRNKTVADAAWDNLSIGPKQGWLKVSQAELERLGKFNVSSVSFRDGSGYLAGFELFHQLHCLNYLRKKTILYHDQYSAMPEDVPQEHHIPHCIDALRLALQCQSEMTLITQNWVDGWLEPWADWRTQHQCRNFASIQAWAAENQPHVPGSFVHPKLGVVESGHLNLSALPINRDIRYVGP